MNPRRHGCSRGLAARRTRCAVAGLLAAFAISSPSADEGRIFVYRSAGTPITQSGHYVLTRDLALALGEEIHIQASHVTLDLRGHEVSKPLSNGEVLIRIAADASQVAILDGRLTGGSIGILYEGLPAVPRARLRIERVQVKGTLTTGIDLQGLEYVDLLSCRVVDAGGTAIELGGMSEPFGGRVAGNTVLRPGADGIALDGLRNGEVQGNLVRDHGLGLAESKGLWLTGTAPVTPGGNLVVGNAVHGGGSNDDGIVVDAEAHDNLLLGNTATANGRRGIHVLSSGNQLVDNVASANLDDGVLVDGSRNRLDGNQVEGNQVNGISIYGDHNLVENNLCEGNRFFGIEFVSSGSHAYRGNMLRDNGSGAVGQWWNATDAGGNVN